MLLAGLVQSAGSKPSVRPLHRIQGHFLRLLSLWCINLDVDVWLSHLDGVENSWADGISREEPSLLAQLDPQRQITVSLNDLLHPLLKAYSAV